MVKNIMTEEFELRRIVAEEVSQALRRHESTAHRPLLTALEAIQANTRETHDRVTRLDAKESNGGFSTHTDTEEMKVVVTKVVEDVIDDKKWGRRKVLIVTVGALLTAVIPAAIGAWAALQAAPMPAP